MDELKENLASLAASLHVLGAQTTANTRDLGEMSQGMETMSQGMETMSRTLETLLQATKSLSQDVQRMASRSKETEATVQELRGTFASIEKHLVTLFERDADARTWREKIEARIEALERRTPPAA